MYAESRQNENKGERGMGKYVLKRFGSMLITLFLIATVTFFLMHLIPGDPFSLPRDTPEVVRENLEEKYGLDKPLFEQYTIYMKNLLHGDFGSSMKYKGQTVVGKLASGMPPSALVGFGGVIIGSIIGRLPCYYSCDFGSINTTFCIWLFDTEDFRSGFETVSYSRMEGIELYHPSYVYRSIY